MEGFCPQIKPSRGRPCERSATITTSAAASHVGIACCPDPSQVAQGAQL
jgi:hypothetical protein